MTGLLHLVLVINKFCLCRHIEVIENKRFQNGGLLLNMETPVLNNRQRGYKKCCMAIN